LVLVWLAVHRRRRRRPRLSCLFLFRLGPAVPAARSQQWSNHLGLLNE
jgi:hypothetical protein